MRTIRSRDLLDLFVVGLLLPIAWFFSPLYWEKVARVMAHLHVFLMGHHFMYLNIPLKKIGLEWDSRQLEINFRKENYFELLYILRNYKNTSLEPKIKVVGLNQLDQALNRKEGAVLWIANFVHSEVIVHKGLHAAGLKVHFLSDLTHGFQSPTKFGVYFLNPIKVNIENKFLAFRHVMRPGSRGEAIRNLISSLRGNGIISIMAIHNGRRVGSAKFLNGKLNLAKGAPNIALNNDSPIFPVFAIRKSNENFEVVVGPQLEVSEAEFNQAEEKLIIQFANCLEKYVLKYPEQWRGWFGGHSSWNFEQKESCRTDYPMTI